jgi:DNA-binding PadR family transcriptional regulator
MFIVRIDWIDALRKKYPILHRLEKENLLKSYSENISGKIRKYYRTTSKGVRMLSKIKEKIRELVDEVME